MKQFRIKGEFTVFWQHDCDCEFCDYNGGYDEGGSITELIIADNKDDAIEEMRLLIFDENERAKDLVFTILETYDIPDNKFILRGDRTFLIDGRFLSDGFVALDQEFAFSVGEVEERESGGIFRPELDYPLGRFAKNDEAAFFVEGIFNAGWLDDLHKLGISVWWLKGQGETEPFGLEKDGRLVGYLMPVHIRKGYDKRHKMINESELFAQPIAAKEQPMK